MAPVERQSAGVGVASYTARAKVAQIVDMNLTDLKAELDARFDRLDHQPV